LILDGHKLEWHRDRVESWLAGEPIAPITIDCALTRLCNLRCVYCYSQLQANEEKKITWDVISRFLDDAAEFGVKAISLVSDGESTCSPYLYDTILHGRKNGLDMALGTNGTLLQQGRIPEILSALTYLRFNISAGEEKRYAEIHGCQEEFFNTVCETIKVAVKVKKDQRLNTMIGLQMVLMPEFADQIMPLARLGKSLGVDYLVIKHCSDDEEGSLGVDYDKYFNMVSILKEAENLSDSDYLVQVKWSKILSSGKRAYKKCYGPAFIMQFSGSGLVAPCGMLFNSKFNKFHIGNIVETSFKEIVQSKKYQEVLCEISSDSFDARTMCGTLCLQHQVNEYLWEIKNGIRKIQNPQGVKPFGVNFI
jgi:MoaA/NifB/PqqE/SkfB family radical SAM enzyme